MFVLTALVYPAVLALLCVGAGLFVDRLSGGFLPGLVLAAVGAAALIAVSQLSTYNSIIAPATPYVMAAVAIAGFALSRRRVLSLASRWRTWLWQLSAPTLAYALALAPVLAAGRPTLSSYMGLADSAVHLIGADYLLHHGRDYAHLDLRNSYGQFINAYYNTSYPSGADTLFGGSALLLRLPLIWAFQPFNGFMLATAAGPALLLARRLGLAGGWAAVAAVSATVPALVYGYELIGSVKEITTLPMILTLGVLVVMHRRWLLGPPLGAVPCALLVAAGVSALGVGFGAWVAGTLVVLVVAVIGNVRAGRQRPRQLMALVAVGSIVTLVSAWPTWLDLSGSLRVARNIATTANPGNLHAPLRSIQVFGIWLRGSYKQLPTGAEGTLTHALIVIALLAGAAGVVHVLRLRRNALAGWLAAMVGVWLGLSQYATTWVAAKSLMLTSPMVVLIVWAGVGAVRASRSLPASRAAARLLALVLAGGVFASDLAQYHASNLAPTERYRELAALNDAFAGRGPTLFTDFDEYALYELRGLDVGGPDFAYPPAALAAIAGGYGYPVNLDRATPAALAAYPLIITRRDPSASPPPSAYRLLRQGGYYEVWGRRPGARPAIAHVAAPGRPTFRCSRVGRLARLAAIDGARLLAASAPTLVRISLAAASHPADWGHQRQALVMKHPGRLAAAFTAPAGGLWDLWLQGQIMPSVAVGVDGHPLASIGGQLAGNSLVPDTSKPLRVRLSAGRHILSVTRGAFTLAPGDGGSAVISAIFLTPAGAAARATQSVAPAGGWRRLCGALFAWFEIARA